MLNYSLEPVFSYQVQLAAPPEIIGPVPEGLRINMYTQRGKVTGEKVQGILRPVGKSLMAHFTAARLW